MNRAIEIKVRLGVSQLGKVGAINGVIQITVRLALL